MLQPFRKAGIAAFVVVSFFASTANAEHSTGGDAENFDRMAPGETLVLAAGIGTTNEVLGLGFDDHFSEFDQAGKSHRAYPAKFKTVKENQYFLQFEQLDNDFLVNAHARFLAAKANVRFESSKRYLVLKMYQLREVAALDPEGEPLEAVPLLAQKVYYGWAMNVVIEGDASTFTSDVAANLISGGAELEATLKKYHLKQHVHLVGLEPKEPGSIPLVTKPEQIAEAFKVSEQSWPIFVEYRVVKDLYSKKVQWTQPGLHAGKYKLAAIKLKVANTKDDGRPWDAMQGPPDPFATVLIDGLPAATCLHKDVFEAECTFDKVVDLTEESTIDIEVLDKDLSENDPIGRAILGNIVKEGHPYSGIELRTAGQLDSATVTFLPMGE